MSGPGAAALARLDTAKGKEHSGSSVRWFLPLFPCPAVLSSPRESTPSRPASDRPQLSHFFLPLFFFTPSTTSSPLPPPPSPFPSPDGQHRISFVCLCVGGLPVFGLSCHRYRVRVDHLVIDKRMRSGEAGKLNSPLPIDSTVRHDNDRYSIPLLPYLSFAITSFSFISFFTISFFPAAIRNSLCRE